MNLKDNMLKEYDFNNDIRGKYAKIYKEGIMIVRLDIDIIKFFSDVKSINKEKPKNRFFEFSGMWKDRDITQKSIREQAWN